MQIFASMDVFLFLFSKKVIHGIILDVVVGFLLLRQNDFQACYRVVVVLRVCRKSKSIEIAMNTILKPCYL